MKVSQTIKTLAFSLFSSLAFSATLQASELKVGDQAPDFTMQATNGKTYKLADFVGKQAVVLAWYPKANTKGCTIECLSLVKDGHLIRAYDVSYFMASVDPLDKNKKFAEETKADFPMLSDPSKAYAEAYGVLNEKGMANRVTFYIDKDGKISKIDKKINVAKAASDMANSLASLGVVKL